LYVRASSPQVTPRTAGYDYGAKWGIAPAGLAPASTAASLAALPPEQARRLAARLEIHHTPKHGSWLNIAEIELSALTLQCLDRRIPDMATLTEETHQWEQRRNQAQKGVDWQFSTQDARIKLKRLYPQI